MSVIELNVTQELIKEIISATKQVMTYYKLGNTELIESVEWVFKDDQFILIANDYFRWVNSGKRPMARKVPVEVLLKWMRRKGIKPTRGQTYNSMAFALQNSIYKSGIKARNIVDPIINVTLDILAEYIAEDLSVSIADELAETMTFTVPENS